MDGECINCGEVGNWCRCGEEEEKKMKPTGIIVVGIDGQGKTPFVEIAVSLLGGEKVKFLDDPRSLTFAAKVQRCKVEMDIVGNTYKDPNYKIRIYDRCPAPDEWIYGPFLNSEEFTEDRAYPPALREVELELGSYNYGYLYMKPLSWSGYLMKVDEEPDDKVPTEHLKKIQERYDRWFAWPSPVVKMAYYTVPSTWWDEESVKSVLDSLFARMGFPQWA